MSDIIVSNYAGAYGPTIRIDTQSVKDLERVLSAFGDLADRKVDELDLVVYLDAKVDNIIGLLTVCDDSTIAKTLECIDRQRNVFRWRQPRAGWRRCEQLGAGLIGNPGHQYLTEEGIDDALIELAFAEPRPADLTITGGFEIN